MGDPVKVWFEREERLLRLRLDRPKANILDAALIGALDAALAAHGERRRPPWHPDRRLGAAFLLWRERRGAFARPVRRDACRVSSPDPARACLAGPGDGGGARTMSWRRTRTRFGCTSHFRKPRCAAWPARDRTRRLCARRVLPSSRADRTRGGGGSVDLGAVYHRRRRRFGLASLPRSRLIPRLPRSTISTGTLLPKAQARSALPSGPRALPSLIA